MNSYKSLDTKDEPEVPSKEIFEEEILPEKPKKEEGSTSLFCFVLFAKT